MDERATKRKGWIKNLMIIFLLIMLILTLFSNTIMNYSLPQISAQYCYGGSITTRIRGNGTIQANQNYSVMLDEDRKIIEVNVTNGSTVQKGDVLFVLSEGENTDLDDALVKLSSLNNERNGYLEIITPGASDNSAELAVSDARKEYNNAVEAAGFEVDAEPEKQQLALEIDSEKKGARIEILSSMFADTGVSEVSLKFDYFGMAAEDLAPILAEFIEKADTASLYLEGAKKDVKKAEQAILNAESAVSEAQLALETFKKEYGDSVPPSDDEIEKMEQAYAEALREFDWTLEDYEKAYKEWEQSLESYTEAVNRANYEMIVAMYQYQNGEGTMADYQAAVKAYEDALDAKNKAAADYPESLISMERNIERTETTLEKQKAELDKAKAKNLAGNHTEKYEDAVAAAETNLAAVKLEKEDAEKALASAEADYKEKYGVALYLEKAILQQEKDELDEKIKTLEEIITLKKVLSDAEKALSNKKPVESTYTAEDIAIAKMRLESVDEKIEQLKIEIEEIKNKTVSNTVTAPVSGIITSLTVVPGKNVKAGDTLAEIQLTDRGYSLSFTATVEQSRKIKIGDTANIQYYWGGDITAVVAEIKVDPSNPAQNRTIVLDVTGDVTSGTNISFTLGDSAQYYDCVVPNSAIREDSNGKFILVVDSKSTPLGNRYTARRVDISVIVSDDTSTAISGVESGQYVITNSSLPIEPGTQVRLVAS